MTSSSRLPIVTYHAVGEGPAPLFLSVDAFESQLDAFARAGYRTLTLGDLAGRLRRGEAPPEDGLVLTFDDGYQSVAREAWPRLRARGLVATVFLVSGHVGRDNRWPTQGPGVPARPLLTWDEAARMAADGAELGAHTRTHAPLPLLSLEAARDEALGSKSDVEARTGASVNTFAAPYGASTPALDALLDPLFDGIATTRLGLVARTARPGALPRVDAHYLDAGTIGRLRDLSSSFLFAGRDLLRRVRRRFVPDWSPAVPT
jgi:peptidoglycan/xylan/chitin deacetylase (PgdA/CDA1 family)